MENITIEQKIKQIIASRLKDQSKIDSLDLHTPLLSLGIDFGLILQTGCDDLLNLLFDRDVFHRYSSFVGAAAGTTGKRGYWPRRADKWNAKRPGSWGCTGRSRPAAHPAPPRGQARRPG